MSKRTIVIGLTVLAVAALLAGAAPPQALGAGVAATIDPTTRTVTSTNFFVDWDETNPEAILDLQWNGPPNLTNSGTVGGCPDPLEFFGNSWVNLHEDPADPDPFVFVSLVGWGSAGTWAQQGTKGVRIHSSSTGCPGSGAVPIETRYKFWDGGAAVNRIKAERTFGFGTTPFVYPFRPYIPRLSPRSDYSQVLHPNADGTSLVLENASLCEFGCQVSNWNGTWFAIHGPATGQGLIVRRDGGLPANLWVDQDFNSDSNASSALLLAPPGGLLGDVTETEFLCFYDNTTWTPSLSLPPGC